MIRPIRILFLAMLAALFTALPAGAQNAAPAADTLVLDEAGIATVQRRIDDLRTVLDRETVTDADLLKTRLDAEALSKRLLAAAVALGPRLTEINARLDQLGPVPGEGQPPETAALAEERSRLQAEKASINTAIGASEDATIEVGRIIDQIGQARRDLFTQTLSRQVKLGDVLSMQTVGDIEAESADIASRLSSWSRFTLSFKFNSLIFALAASLAAALAISTPGMRWLNRLLDRTGTDSNPNYFTKLFSALLKTFVPSAIFALVMASVFYAFEYFQIWRTDIRALAMVIAQVAVAIFFVIALVRAVFAPSQPEFRLVAVESTAARRILLIASFIAVVAGVDFALGGISEILSSPVSLTVARSFFSVMFVGIALIAIAFLKPFANDDGSPRGWPTLVKRALLLLGFLPIALALLGFVSLARFSIQQIVITGAILMTMYIGYLSAAAMMSENDFVDSLMARRFAARFKLDNEALGRFGIVAALATYVLVTLAGLPLIALQWGYQPDEIRVAAHKLLNELTIGSVTISLTAIAFGVVAFFIGFWVTRRFQDWLDRSVLTRSKMDKGVRTSIKTAIGYAGIAVAALIGVSVAGFNLSNLALVAGALSLGIGFGMQNIVSNFVSGLILLAERPFKEGDWIEAGNVQGFVKKISVRATEIETFQRQSVMMPNSELINSAVGNWTHRNLLARVDIMVGVGYGSDVVLVQDTLRQIAHDHPEVMRNPEPFVLFKDFGASSLDFELRVFVSDLFRQAVVQTELRTTIAQKFKELGIEIPFPQRDVNLKLDGAPVTAEEVQTIASAARRRRRKKTDPDT